MLIAFFIIIPIINGVMDVVSWAASRWMAAHLRKQLNARAALPWRVTGILGHTLADAAIALASLLALAWLLAFLFEFAAKYGVFGPLAGGEGSFVRGMLPETGVSPWPDAYWLVFLLATTLGPTAIHLVFLTFTPVAILALPDAQRRELIARLQCWETSDANARRETEDRVATYFARGRLRVWFAAAAIVVLGPIGVGIGVHAVFGIGLWGALGEALVATAEHAIAVADALAG